MSVTLVISAGCTISASALTFPGSSVLSSTIDGTTTVTATCTNTTPYNIGLDQGSGTGATVATRYMTASGVTVSYSLYQDSGHGTVWGVTQGTNTLSETGNGSAQSWTVYGEVFSQTSVKPGTYSDTVNVYVYY
jgi:spore coat protein U-like protein